MTLLSIALVVSATLNVLLIWYARRLTAQFLFFTENVADLETALTTFDTHLKGVHEMEMFYGDDTLQGLIEHSKFIVNRVNGFYESFTLEEGVPDEEDEEDIDENR